MILTAGFSFLIVCMISSPSLSGIRMSGITRSAGNYLYLSSSACPSDASSITFFQLYVCTVQKIVVLGKGVGEINVAQCNPQHSTDVLHCIAGIQAQIQQELVDFG